MNCLTLLTTIVLSVATTNAIAQSPDSPKEQYVIAHRLSKWHTKHFQDEAKAQQHADALKRLGAEVRIENHSDHIDVTCRSTIWQPLRVENDELAHQWQDWLKAAGFETIHGHRPEHDRHAHGVRQAHHEEDDHAHHKDHGEVLHYRASAWGTQHFNKAVAAEQFVAITEALRCEVQRAGHAGHTDIRFRCPEWTAVEFADPKTAEAWEKWLSSAGFEVRHEDSEHDH